jgi:hypothetical protein
MVLLRVLSRIKVRKTKLIFSARAIVGIDLVMKQNLK